MDVVLLWGVPVGALVVVTAAALGTARLLERRQRDERYDIARALITRHVPTAEGRHGTPWSRPGRPPERVPDDLLIPDWDGDQVRLWTERLDGLRGSYLERTRATAGRWRDLFAALTALAGGVLGVAGGNGGARAVPEGAPQVALLVVVSLALALALDATALAGWAAVGLPRSFREIGTPSQMRLAELRHAARSQQRLRVALACGAAAVALAAVASLVAFGASLTAPSGG
ncbi:hypothetical protein [Cellulomonas endophytica]|uniref:hypothetical protein n=1 Tax=Cellulomonas endophytica TaxID=2494735 RepID=UPI0010138FF4|nr:hypothetical protein [Cellulomonas endophytica]